MAKVVYGLDTGFGSFKIYGKDTSALVVSHVAEVDGSSIDFGAIGGDKKVSAQLISNGVGRFWVGLGASDLGRVNSRMDYEKLSGSPEMVALFYAVLGKTGATHNDSMHLTVGVPFGFVSGDGVKERVAQLKGWMIGEHEWLDGKRQRAAKVASVSIISQAQAAYLDYGLNINGTDNDSDIEGEIGVISIGHNTVELIVLEDGVPSRKFAYSEKLGVRRMLETINASKNNAYEIAELDTKLRASKLDTDKAIVTWGSEVIGMIERRWNESHKRFNKVVAVGGGVKFLSHQLKGLFGSRLVVPDEPVMSVSRGLYKHGVSQ